MNIWLINRTTGETQMTQTSEYQMANDYVTAERSRFTIIDSSITYNRGDYIVAKFEASNKFAYLGIIESVENKEFVANTILSLANFEIVTTRCKGDSFEKHARDLLMKYLVNDPTKNAANIVIDVEGDTPHLYQPKDPPTPVSLMKYLINGFKKYNIVWEFVKFENGLIYTVIKAKKVVRQLENKVDAFFDWKFSNTEVGIGVKNMLVIVDKSTTNMEAPKILSTWFLTTDNEVTQNNKDPKISKPTMTTVNIYDTTVTDKPAYIDVAKSELSGNTYSHEISCKMRRNNYILDVEDISLGLLVNIRYDNVVYKSVLSGYRIEDEESIELQFGHIRSRFSELLG